MSHLGRQGRRDAVWRAANALAYSVIDENGRHTVAGLSAKLALGQLPQWQITRLMAYWAWWEAVWAHHKAVKDAVMAGEPVEFDPSVPGPCPYTIWQLAYE